MVHLDLASSYEDRALPTTVYPHLSFLFLGHRGLFEGFDTPTFDLLCITRFFHVEWVYTTLQLYLLVVVTQSSQAH